MKKMLSTTVLLACLCAGGASPLLAQSTAAVKATGAASVSMLDVEPFLKSDSFRQIKLSPDGRFLAATVPLVDRTAMAVIRRSDNKMMASFQLGQNRHVDDFEWVSATYLLFGMSERFGTLEQPVSIGELFAVNADSGVVDLLVGARVANRGPGTRIQPKNPENVAAFLTDKLLNDPRHVVVTVWPFSKDPFSRAERLDITSGRRVLLARAPVTNARFVTDNDSEVRFALGRGSDNVSKLYYRTARGDDWRLLNDEAISGRRETPLGFSADNHTAYLQVEAATGPDAIVAWDVASDQRRELLRNPRVDPYQIVRAFDSDVPVGAIYMDGKPSAVFFDDNSREARTYRALAAAFPGQLVRVTSVTADGKTALVEASSDRNPGDFYLFEINARKADLLMSRSSWIEPDRMAQTRPFSFKARDGLIVHGYLTLPHGKGERDLPMVVMPHGGPFGVFDSWGYDPAVQMLAAAGYAVMQVNFRGSGNYGRAFTNAGARQWGQAMQDDVTDATRWAINEKHADPRRICIYGASYGAYAALMGAVRAPDLYRCAVGYVGVYDLPLMHTRGDIRGHRSGVNYLRDWVGERNELAVHSPNNLAEKIKIPVFLAAGGQDERTPIEHSRRMERALNNAGAPVETQYYPS
ncbi:MAG: prolyl oligopeptidase family serine peptidase, partial [Pseudomonadota bacterium]|nr:prolyl oligopeptidase family serine peptidase [Pseudomonadota bacterium]